MGMPLQVDGSHHDWLEGRGSELVLLAAIDDATTQITYASFREQEDAAGYFLMLREICRTKGLPLALYADRHTIFQSPSKEPSLAEQLAGMLPRSQFGRLVDELGIRLIPAHSPQAKGRVERLFGTLQDRLVKALRRANARALAEANQVLENLPARLQRSLWTTASLPWFGLPALASSHSARGSLLLQVPTRGCQGQYDPLRRKRLGDPAPATGARLCWCTRRASAPHGWPLGHHLSWEDLGCV